MDGFMSFPRNITVDVIHDFLFSEVPNDGFLSDDPEEGDIGETDEDHADFKDCKTFAIMTVILFHQFIFFLQL